MALETAYFIAQIIAAIAVVASLIFVGLQVRAQTAEQEARRLQDRIALTATLNKQTVEDKELRRVMIKVNQKGVGSLTQEEIMIMSALFRNILLLTQINYFNAPKGGLPDRNAIGTLARALTGPMLQDLWPRLKSDYSPDFVEFVERLRAWGIAEGLDAPVFALRDEPVEEREQPDDA
ncbi:MAG: hypothetical protein EP347_08440 [Alphaproteobacteria bacterium]|nr:MAG: hypothetical protein EP347_08440 [Alphaproteobacteria bacterium]